MGVFSKYFISETIEQQFDSLVKEYDELLDILENREYIAEKYDLPLLEAGEECDYTKQLIKGFKAKLKVAKMDFKACTDDSMVCKKAAVSALNSHKKSISDNKNKLKSVCIGKKILDKVGKETAIAAKKLIS